MAMLMLVIVLAGVVCKGEPTNRTLTLGYLLSWSHEWPAGPYIGSAIAVAIQEVHRRQLLPGYKINWILKDTWCQSAHGVKAAVDIWNRTRYVDGFIGGGCSVVCVPVSLLAAAWGLPVISYGCISDTLSDKTTHPTFTRVVGLATDASQVFFSMVELFQWNCTAILMDAVDLYLNMGYAFDDLVQASGRQTFLYTFQSTVTKDELQLLVNLQKLRQIMQHLKSSCRIIFIFSYSLDVRNTLVLAHEMDMVKGFAYIGPNAELQLQRTLYRPEMGPEVYEGVIDLEVTVFQGPEWDRFRQEVIDSFQTPQFYEWEHIAFNASIDSVNSYAGLIHDSVLLWAYGVNRTLEQGFSSHDGFRVTQNIINSSIRGITGDVVINALGDRKSDYAFNMVQNGEVVTIMKYQALQDKVVKYYKADQPSDWEGLVWPGNQTSVPRDSPECGWNQELCQPSNDSTRIAVISVVAVAAVICITLVGLIFVTKHRRKRHIKEALSHIISWSDVDALQKANTGSHGSMGSDDNYFVDIQIASHNAVKWKSSLVYVKHLGKGKVDITEKTNIREIKDMVAAKHDNLAEFFGVCVDMPNACSLMAYGSRGSLHDVIYSQDVILPWDFKVSMITDIANGMKYLHTIAPGWHGHFSSRNCIVDQRWMCKITDYGLHHLRQCALGQQHSVVSNALLWTAPELLRANRTSFEGSKKGDVYSFGIICQEILTQSPPYSGSNLSPGDIISKVIENLNPPFRPYIPEGICSDEWLKFVKQCWNEGCEERPNFIQILSSIRNMNRGNSSNLIDSMVNRLEFYATKLEQIVTQRTEAINEEKCKVEHILEELLPKTIANSLKMGHKINPESFKCVTLFFSDIVGFTRISAAGTPIDVVKMLNDMYTCFDDISAEFDVFKVATIGDAYFVASGVPVRNGDRHAGEICSLALRLLQAVTTLQAPHLPDETLKMRVGIHSGPCLAGVAGIKMPRYLLFGDTVDIASKMEAYGNSMKIHVSCQTKKMTQDCQFYFEERAQKTVINGKEFATYWLSCQ